MIINADDYGISQGVSQGIDLLVSKGVVNSASVMMRCGDFSFKDVENISYGLHLTLTGKFKPQVGYKTIVDKDGFFKEPKDFFSDVIKGKIDRDELKHEMESQLKDFFSKFNMVPVHIDSHHYIHQLPLVSDVLIEVLLDKKLYDVTIRNCSTSIVKACYASPTSIFKVLFLHIFGSKLKLKLELNGLKTNRHFFGIYKFGSVYSFRRSFSLFKKIANNEDIVVVHPAVYIDDKLSEVDSLLEERVIEYKSLVNYDVS